MGWVEGLEGAFSCLFSFLLTSFFAGMSMLLFAFMGRV